MQFPAWNPLSTCVKRAAIVWRSSTGERAQTDLTFLSICMANGVLHTFESQKSGFLPGKLTENQQKFSSESPFGKHYFRSITPNFMEGNLKREKKLERRMQIAKQKCFQMKNIFTIVLKQIKILSSHNSPAGAPLGRITIRASCSPKSQFAFVAHLFMI